jgi:hypothetical protein
MADVLIPTRLERYVANMDCFSLKTMRKHMVAAQPTVEGLEALAMLPDIVSIRARTSERWATEVL